MAPTGRSGAVTPCDVFLPPCGQRGLSGAGASLQEPGPAVVRAQARLAATFPQALLRLHREGMDPGPRGRLWVAAASSQQSPSQTWGSGQQSQPQTSVWSLPGRFQGLSGRPAPRTGRTSAQGKTQPHPHEAPGLRSLGLSVPRGLPFGGRRSEAAASPRRQWHCGLRVCPHRGRKLCSGLRLDWSGPSRLWWQRTLTLQAEREPGSRRPRGQGVVCAMKAVDTRGQRRAE